MVPSKTVGSTTRISKIQPTPQTNAQDNTHSIMKNMTTFPTTKANAKTKINPKMAKALHIVKHIQHLNVPNMNSAHFPMMKHQVQSQGNVRI